jgi:hypothetical protein
MSSTKTSQITLRYDDDSQQVRIEPDETDLFFMSASEAAKACRIYDQLDMVRFAEQYKHLLDTLAKWANSQRESVARAILTTRDAGFLFLVCKNSVQYDAALEDSLTGLDLAIAGADEFSTIKLSVLAIPSATDEAVGAFVNPSVIVELQNADK